MNHHGATKAEMKKLRFYYRLIMAYSDFKHAFRCSEYMLSEHDDIQKNGGDELPLRAFYCSSVVSYSRPFNSSAVTSIGKIRPIDKEIEAVYSKEELETHNYIINCRNTMLAHSDASEIDPEPVVSEFPSGDLVFPLTSDRLAPFTKEYTLEARQLYEKALTWSVEERMRLEKEVSHLLEHQNDTNTPLNTVVT